MFFYQHGQNFILRLWQPFFHVVDLFNKRVISVNFFADQIKFHDSRNRD
ncbi:hypothetical protein C3B55_00847 [Candidatus Pseudomonas adelgestsugas]|uniref:Uncharacterized protein n=1 Tax=Candidatus Pseudomonas adelgestsugas TaxID=1302376 RepID=A0ABX5R935_9PSED|nr:hypothetical protein C3B55_00847 [Candidatus Pseudomonas adelgestsugas]